MGGRRAKNPHRVGVREAAAWSVFSVNAAVQASGGYRVRMS